MAKLPRRSKIIIVGINLFFLSILLSTIVSIYPLELYVSLLPYLLAISLLLLLLEIMSIKVYGLPRKTSLILLCISLLLLSYPVFLLVDQVVISPSVNIQTKNTLKIAFQNKYYLNANLDEIIKQVKEIDPDIVSFAEIVDFDGFKAALDKYPYTYKTNLSNLMGVAIFSKYELKDSIDEHAAIGEPNHSPYIKTKVIMPDKSEVNLIITHLIAPTGPSFTSLKGDALTKLYSEVDKLDGNIIVMGDFNTTPYSPQISSFRNSSKLYSASKGKGLLDTWEGPSFLKFQIDHSFVSKNMKVDKFEVKDTAGSDHHMIYLETSF